MQRIVIGRCSFGADDDAEAFNSLGGLARLAKVIWRVQSRTLHRPSTSRPR